MKAVLLCGGSGSRLWPLSRMEMPKQFIRLEDNLSFIQRTFIRIKDIPNLTEIIIVTNKDFVYQIESELKEILSVNNNNIPIHFIAEPFGKNTAASIVASAIYVSKDSENEPMIICPADHLVENQESFVDTIKHAIPLIDQEKIVTFGINPTSAETHYGYIRADGNKVLEFVEKPSKFIAQKYFNSGNFFWNSGIFCFTPKVILSEMLKYSEKILKEVEISMKFSLILDKGNKITYQELDKSLFSNVPSNSIDYAVMEKSKKIAVLRCNIGWSDIGNWDSMSSLVEPDSQGNRVKGNAMLEDVSDCYIENKGQVIAAIGVKNLAIINTENGLLVTNKKRANDIKKIYPKLQTKRKPEKNIIKFGWGQKSIITNSNNAKIYHVDVLPNKVLNICDYFSNNANWMVYSGTGVFIDDNKRYVLGKNMSKYVELRNNTKLMNNNVSLLSLVVMEISNHFHYNIASNA